MGEVNRALLLWQGDGIFVALTNETDDQGKYAMSLWRGVDTYREEILRLYSFADRSSEELEAHIRDRFPYLKELWEQVQQNR